MKELNFKTIGSKIKERRNELGYTQDYVSAKLNVNPSHVSNIECGRANPSLTALVNIANTLECSVDYFISAEYTYPKMNADLPETDAIILERLKYCEEKKKQQFLQIINILQ